MLLSTKLLPRLYILAKNGDKDAMKWNFPGSAIKCQSCRKQKIEGYSAKHGQQSFPGDSGRGSSAWEAVKGVNGLHEWFNRYKFLDRYDETKGARH